jgi:hypothetical protein
MPHHGSYRLQRRQLTWGTEAEAVELPEKPIVDTAHDSRCASPSSQAWGYRPLALSGRLPELSTECRSAVRADKGRGQMPLSRLGFRDRSDRHIRDLRCRGSRLRVPATAVLIVGDIAAGS